jgi:hypothetical protein
MRECPEGCVQASENNWSASCWMGEQIPVVDRMNVAAEQAFIVSSMRREVIVSWRTSMVV